MILRIIISVIAVVLVCGCDRPPSRVSLPGRSHTLTWTNYDGFTGDPREADYFLDGKYLGRGSNAVAQLKLCDFEAGASVVVLYPWYRSSSMPSRDIPYRTRVSQTVTEHTRSCLTMDYDADNDLGEI